uniref:Mitogen-activated protein kinase-binding protein 1 n=1 Tax=Cacopsylla melanoneura TaxID=428564 RepID=A0A8D9ANH6_9HEMI
MMEKGKTNVKIERVLGLTVPSNAALNCNPVNGIIAYPAGCTVVFLNPHKNKQTHLLNVSRKAISCLAFSADGRYLATGECGHQPSVRVWDLNDNSQVAEFSSHKYGVSCVIFSPNQKFVVSVGCQHDMIVNVWEWKSNVKIASNKVSNKVKSVTFSESGNYFVTVGNRHVKYWYLQSSRSTVYKEPVPLMGRSAILGEQRNNDFVDAACGKGSSSDSTYAITKSGLLCEFNNRRLLDKWVELRTNSAKCITIGELYIFVGCADGIVRCFDPVSLQFITTLPRTHYLGVDVSMGKNISHMASAPKDAKYPDAIAVAFDELNNKLTCVYNDHSLYIWDVRDIKRVGKSHSYLYHSACIWGVEIVPPGSAQQEAHIPAGSFVTCSSDDTIRVWNLDDVTTNSDSVYQRNIYTNELLKILYIDPELNYLKDMDMSSGDKNESSSYDGRNGVRSIRISPDGKHLASGDRTGNIRIHELNNLNQVCLIEAHDAEVLCLEFSPPESSSSSESKRPRLLTSASRDRLLHVFNVDDRYNFLQTLDDHSSSITAVRFYTTPDDRLHMVSCGADKSIIFRQLGDSPDSPNVPQFNRDQVVAGKTTLYDMEIDCTQKHVITACQDRNIRVYNINSGKHSKTFEGSIGDEGSLIKVVLDNSGIFVATSCTDKTLCIYDYYSGECMATMTGHSELVTGLRFSSDCRRLISASGDGCIFVWKVPHDMVVTMHARLSQQAARAGSSLKLLIEPQENRENERPYAEDNHSTNDNPISIQRYNDQLPLWAKRQMSSDDLNPIVPSVTPSIEAPKGRWAQRVDPTGIIVKSYYDGDSVIPSPMTKEKILDSDGSKEDSSVDSGTETSRSLYPDVRRESLIIPKKTHRGPPNFLNPETLKSLLNDEMSKQPHSAKGSLHLPKNFESENHRSRHHTDDSSLGSFKYEDMESTEHDGDVEDYSEGESLDPEPRHDTVYYPDQSEESVSEFRVNALDSDELRRSSRRLKQSKPRPDRLLSASLADFSSRSVSGSQDSEDEEDDVSTPSGDNADKTVLSGLNVSTEHVNLLGQREKYLKDTFESLSGAEDISKELAGKKKSLSSQYHGVTTKKLKNDPETLRKREELQRRIEETRKQLQSVGNKSNIKCSQSISDLSRIHQESPSSQRLHKFKHSTPYKQHQPSPAAVDDQLSGSMRRSCSLSDLANPTSTPSRAHNHVENNKSAPPKPSSRTLQRPKLPPSAMTRSSSVGILHQSDSESDLSQKNSKFSSNSRILRPTISSQNKMSTNSKVKSMHRRAMTSSYSSMAIHQIGRDDSSSEELPDKSNQRPRSSSIDRSNLNSSHRRNPLGRSGSERDISVRGRQRLRPSSMVADTSYDNAPTVLDVKNAPISQQLIASMAEQLTRAADSVVQLHKRLAVESMEGNLIEDLQGAIGEAQSKLKIINLNNSVTNESNPVQDGTSSPSTTPGEGDVVSMMQQYSDMLVSLVQQRMLNETK